MLAPWLVSENSLVDQGSVLWCFSAAPSKTEQSSYWLWQATACAIHIWYRVYGLTPGIGSKSRWSAVSKGLILFLWPVNDKTSFPHSDMVWTDHWQIYQFLVVLLCQSSRLSLWQRPVYCVGSKGRGLIVSLHWCILCWWPTKVCVPVEVSIPKLLSLLMWTVSWWPKLPGAFL